MFKNNLIKIIFCLILVLSLFLRFYKLGVNPPSLDWDESSIGYNAYSILHTAKDEYGNFMPLSFRSFDDYKPPVYVYLTVPSVFIFGLTEFAVRFPAAVFGVLSVVVVYFLTKELFSSLDKNKREWLALSASFFLCISPWHLQFSRAAFEGNVGMFFLILSLLLFFKSFKKPGFYLLFSISFILSMYSYHSFRLLNPLVLAILIILFYKKLLKQKVLFVISLLLIIVLALPIYASFINPQGTGARLSMVTIFSDPKLLKISADNLIVAKAKNDIVGQIINNRRLVIIPQMIKGYFDHFSSDFLFMHGDGGVQHHAYNMGMLYLWDFPFILLGIYSLLKKPERKTIFLLFLFLLAPLPASITTGTPHPVRAIAMIPALQIFTALGFVFLAQKVLRMKYQILRIKLSYITIGIVSMALLINVTYYLHSYYVLTPVKYGYFWQFGNKEAVLYAKGNENKYDKIIISYEYDQPYIYYLFYNKIDPAWYQKNWDYAGNGTIDRFYRKIGKYEFRNIDYTKDKNLKNTLLIGTPDELKDASSIYNILFPDGRVAYKITGS